VRLLRWLLNWSQRVRAVFNDTIEHDDRGRSYPHRTYREEELYKGLVSGTADDPVEADLSEFEPPRPYGER
jgi:hypothetical protein